MTTSPAGSGWEGVVQSWQLPLRTKEREKLYLGNYVRVPATRTRYITTTTKVVGSRHVAAGEVRSEVRGVVPA